MKTEMVKGDVSWFVIGFAITLAFVFNIGLTTYISLLVT